VLINGASGGVGTFAVQLAKAFGAHVTAVCSTRNVDRMRTLGADQVIDYKQEDFTKSGQQVDLIIAVNGYHTLSDYKRALKPGGVYVAAGGKMAQIFESLLLGAWHSMVSGKKIKSVTAKPNRDDLAFIGDLLAAGKIMPVIDRCYLFSEAIEALRYLGEGHAQGKVVISMGASPTTG
jgi:NADPH:quinone reductase-like Zn-dependent oxidoreductase